jgi:dipeptidyl aminopeptidase/acylaminoacyl peptidase
VKTGQLIPLAALFGDPERAEPRISPDGRRLAYLAPSEGALNVWVTPAGRDDARPVTGDTHRGIRSYRWAHDNRHLLYLQDSDGDENWRVYAVDPDSGETRLLTPFPQVQARIEGLSRRQPGVLAVGLNLEDRRTHDLYRLDLRSGVLTLAARNRGFAAWLVDRDLQATGAVRSNVDSSTDVLVRAWELGKWRRFAHFPAEDAMVSAPLGFTAYGDAMLLRSSAGADTTRLVRRDLRSGEERVLAHDPEFDLGNVLVHPDTGEAQAVSFVRERLEWEVLDPSLRDDFAALSATNPGDFGIVGRDHADRTWLVSYTVDSGPVSSYLYDRASRRATFLFDHTRELRSYVLAAMAPFSLRARDGLTLRGYLTLPPAGERKRLPTVLLVHGGPWQRDRWGYVPEAQWLANRGYLVVQVNFRGSSGYGKEFLNAGDREWGGRMQDDLIDTVRWSVEQDLSDPDRVGILGASYGGYAALCGAAFTPDVFRCAVSICGPSNLATWIETAPPYWGSIVAMLHRRVGDPESDREMLWSRSPLSRVDRIRIPVLLAHGAMDPRVKLAETEQVAAAMERAGVEHQLLVFADEGHGFARPENRLRLYAAADRFLATHLGGRAGPLDLG